MTAPASTFDVLEEVRDERERQEAKWGQQNHPDGTGPANLFLGSHLAGAYETLADRARQACDQRHRAGKGTWADIMLEELFEAMAEYSPTNLRTELIQVAAVATAWVEAIDRRTAANKEDNA